MVQIEGQGRIPPAPLSVVLTNGSLLQLLREAKLRSKYRSYGSRQDQWGQGLTEAKVIPNVGSIDKATMPILAGLVGEHAICHTITNRSGVKVSIDCVLRPSGDGGKDIVANGVRIDAKTRLRDYDTFLVRHADEQGRKCELLADFYAFASWNKGSVVTIHGCITRLALIECPVHDAKRGKHTNYEVQPDDLLPMSRLFDEIRSRDLWH